MFIESLARLNYWLQKAGSTITVVAFIIMPAATHSYTIQALQGQAVTKQLRDTVTDIQSRVGERLLNTPRDTMGKRTTLTAYRIALTSTMQGGRQRIPPYRAPAFE